MRARHRAKPYSGDFAPFSRRRGECLAIRGVGFCKPVAGTENAALNSAKPENPGFRINPLTRTAHFISSELVLYVREYAHTSTRRGATEGA